MEETTMQPMPLWVVILIPFAFLIIFPLFWCGVVWLLAQLAGWSRLATRYRTEQAPSGTRFSAIYGHIGLVSYRGMLECVANDEGLYLRPGMMFRVGHPPLFIPWTEFQDVKPYRSLWLRVVRARIGQPSVGRLALEAKVFENSPGKKILPQS